MLRGLQLIHSQNLLHLDLKPENLFLTEDSGRIKIGDFGLLLNVKDWDEQEGDREYLAPEILMNQASNASDIFSAGLIVVQMLGGITRLPGNGDGWHALREGRAPVTCEPGGEGLAAIAKGMIEPDPEGRPSAEELVALDEFQSVPVTPNTPMNCKFSKMFSGSQKHLLLEKMPTDDKMDES